ncbi:hypothetical protein KBB45_00525 [Myxococcota bacterium]|jgi:hypothetical protein|nr:hypothetical protein [Myxococcota bacterium]MBP8970550.1 hypothetical protein [Myxococcota bacterium]HQL57314.1 hypothetical protein [Myxococcota bacterium]
MHFSRNVFLAGAALFLAQFMSCMDCDRSGCEVLDKAAPAADITQGLAGAGAVGSDMIGEYLGQTCQECPFMNVSFQIWKTESATLTAVEAKAICCLGDPLHKVSTDPWYEVALDAGDYLACTRAGEQRYCTGFTVADGLITTLHILQKFGPCVFYVSKPGDTPLEVDEPLVVSCEE